MIGVITFLLVVFLSGSILKIFRLKALSLLSNRFWPVLSIMSNEHL